MIHLAVLCILLGLNLDISEACNPDPRKWTPHEKEMFECLKRRMEMKDLVLYFHRVLNPKSRTGSVSIEYQNKAGHCVTIEDYLRYDIKPEGYTPTARAAAPTTRTPSPATSALPPTTWPATPTTRRSAATTWAPRSTTWTRTPITRVPSPTTWAPTLTTRTPTPTKMTSPSIMTPAATTSAILPTTEVPPLTTMASPRTTMAAPPTTTASPSTTTLEPSQDKLSDLGNTVSNTLSKEIWVMQSLILCLRSNGLGHRSIRDWYNRVFDSGRVSPEDQVLAEKCTDAGGFLILRVVPDEYTATPTTAAPTQTNPTTASTDIFTDVSPRERPVLLCLKGSGRSDSSIREWYNRVLNPSSRSGRVSWQDQHFGRDCIDVQGFLQFLVEPDGYTQTTTAAPAPTTPLSTTPSSYILTGASTRENRIFECLKAKGWSGKRLRTWYNRVLNPETSRVPCSGRATLLDQDLVSGCMDAEDFLYYGVRPDGYTATSTPRPTTTPETALPMLANEHGDVININLKVAH